MAEVGRRRAAGWRDRLRAKIGALSDEVAWRLALEGALRRSAEEEPVTVRNWIETARSILVVSPGGLAALPAALPVLRALRRANPAASLDLATTAAAASLLEKDALGWEGMVDQPWGELPLPQLRQWREFRAAADRVAARGYQAVFCFDPEGDRALAILAHLTGARLRVAWGDGTNDVLYNVQLRPETKERYLPERNLEMLKRLGLSVAGVPLVWELAEKEAEVAERLLQLKQLKGSRPLVAFDPGRNMGEAPDGGATMLPLAQTVERLTGARGIVLSESDQCELPPAGTPLEAARSLGIAGLRETVRVLSRCDGFVGRNTPFFHLAVALGVPSVGLMPPGAPSWWRPRGRPGVLLLEKEGPPGETASEVAERLRSLWEIAAVGGRE